MPGKAPYSSAPTRDKTLSLHIRPIAYFVTPKKTAIGVARQWVASASPFGSVPVRCFEPPRRSWEPNDFVAKRLDRNRPRESSSTNKLISSLKNCLLKRNAIDCAASKDNRESCTTTSSVPDLRNPQEPLRIPTSLKWGFVPYQLIHISPPLNTSYDPEI